jgi:hypothetical protein
VHSDKIDCASVSKEDWCSIFFKTLWKAFGVRKVGFMIIHGSFMHVALVPCKKPCTGSFRAITVRYLHVGS